jgi:hypothetical protein
MMRLAMYWLLLLLVPTVSFAIDYGVMAFKTIFFPTPVDIAIELDRYPSLLKPPKRKTSHVFQPQNPTLHYPLMSVLVFQAAHVGAAGACGRADD